MTMQLDVNEDGRKVAQSELKKKQVSGDSYTAISAKELGKRGEDAAVKLLQEKGYEIVARNYMCVAGEADIIAIDEGCLVFIEVKTRSDISKGFPEEAVGPRKRARYERIAAYYISEHDCSCSHIRFDVIGILVAEKNKALARHIINAFG